MAAIFYYFNLTKYFVNIMGSSPHSTVQFHGLPSQYSPIPRTPLTIQSNSTDSPHSTVQFHGLPSVQSNSRDSPHSTVQFHGLPTQYSPIPWTPLIDDLQVKRRI